MLATDIAAKPVLMAALTLAASRRTTHVHILPVESVWCDCLPRPRVAALGTAVAYFVEDEVQPRPPAKHVAPTRRSPVVHEGERKSLSPNSGVTFYLLDPDMSGAIEFIYGVFEPGASTGDELYAHPGVECGLVLAGALEVQVGDETYLLSKGDSITFSSGTPHRKCNVGKVRSISSWANTPPWF